MMDLESLKGIKWVNKNYRGIKMNRNKHKYSQEIMEFAVDLLEKGHSEKFAVMELKEIYGIKVNPASVLCWFREKRVSFLGADTKAERNYQDAVNYNKRVAKLKKQAQTGLILIYIGEVPGKTSSKPIMGEKHSVIKKVYNNFILTEDGAIQFNDVKGVVNFG